jgi:hypothetical protein
MLSCARAFTAPRTHEHVAERHRQGGMRAVLRWYHSNFPPRDVTLVIRTECRAEIAFGVRLEGFRMFAEYLVFGLSLALIAGVLTHVTGIMPEDALTMWVMLLAP